MRTKNLFKSLVAATLAVVSVNAFGQGGLTTATPVAGADFSVKTATAWNGTAGNANNLDIVTVTSKMPYSVDRDANQAALDASSTSFWPSVFNWALNVPAAGAFQIPTAVTGLTVDDGSNGTANNGPNYFTQNDVAVKWANTPGTYQITVRERPENSAGLTVCDGQVENIDVWVMRKPTASFMESSLWGEQGTAGFVNGIAVATVIGTASDETIGGCGISDATNPTNIQLPIRVTGTDLFTLAYDIDFYDISDLATIASTNSYSTAATFDAGLSYLSLVDHNYLVGLENNNNQIQLVVPAVTYGKWVVRLTGITDRISRKTLSDPDGDGVANQDMGTILATGEAGAIDNSGAGAGVDQLTVWSLPTPTTGTIKHVTNTKSW